MNEKTKKKDQQSAEDRLIDILEVFAEETRRPGAPARPLTSDERAAIRTTRSR